MVYCVPAFRFVLELRQQPRDIGTDTRKPYFWLSGLTQSLNYYGNELKMTTQKYTLTEITQREVSPLTAKDVLEWADEITRA